VGNRILVSVFDSEPLAFEGMSALKELHRNGDITVYASTVIAKDPLGNVSVRQSAERGPIGTLVGVVTGGLIGLLGGPAAAAVGAYIGGFGGLMYDMFKAGVSMDFVEEVGQLMIPGKAAIIVDVDEPWETPVDTRLGFLGGTTFRRSPGEVIDAELLRENEAARKELEQLRAELKTSSAEAKANIQSSIDAQRRKLEAMNDRIEKRLAEQKAEFEARLATLREQQAKASESKKEQIETRKTELKASYEERKEKLEESRRQSKESLDEKVEDVKN
jgi:uncharacterized membrane protein